jgi:hypothetical protein
MKKNRDLDKGRLIFRHKRVCASEPIACAEALCSPLIPRKLQAPARTPRRRNSGTRSGRARRPETAQVRPQARFPSLTVA